MVKIESNDFSKYGISICKTILKWYEDNEIQIESNIPLKLVYRPNKYPEFIPKSHIIYIGVEDTKWNQFIFQLAHEICHYIIYLCNCNNYQVISWLEESICEAVSYFWLKKYSIQWITIGFNKIDNKYGKQIHKYLINELNKITINYPSLDSYNIKSLYELNCISEESEGRNKRHSFVKILYEYVNTNTIKSLVNYQRFIKSEILVDTIKYKQDYNNDVVNYICNIQDIIERNL